MADSARDEVLARVRAALASSGTTRATPAAAALPGAPLGPTTFEARAARFVEALERVGGRVHRARGEDEAARAVATIVAELGAREVALSDDALVSRLAARLPDGVRTFDGWRDRERLFACDLGLSAAQRGVAETGTLVLESSAERHRLVSLVPPVHVAVLRGSELLPGLGEALAQAADARSRAVTLVTGPSRTADIELELVVGVHGPRALHVVLLDPQPTEEPA